MNLEKLKNSDVNVYFGIGELILWPVSCYFINELISVKLEDSIILVPPLICLGAYLIGDGISRLIFNKNLFNRENIKEKVIKYEQLEFEFKETYR